MAIYGRIMINQILTELQLIKKNSSKYIIWCNFSGVTWQAAMITMVMHSKIG